MIQYILECIAFQLVFLIIYDLFLKKETFFQWNRVCLIGTYVLSLLLPWIKIEALKTNAAEVFQGYPEFMWNANDAAIVVVDSQKTDFSVSWEYMVLFGGMFLATLFFGYKLFQLYKLRQQGEVHYFKDFTRIVISNSAMAFSFFKSIFLGDRVLEKEHQNILEHELVHIRERHSYDLLFFEIMRIVCWFNPLVYVYQNRISELHEFIADAKVAKTSKKEQYEFLLSQVFQTQNISFINQFFKSSLIKKRIVMLQKTKSKKIWQLKYLLILPLVLGMLVYTSCQEESEDKRNEAVTLQSSVDIPFAVVNEVPVFPGCEDANDKRDCFSAMMQKHIAKNFVYPTEAQEKGIQGRVSIMFTISKDGSIQNVKMRGPDKLLEDEAARIISKLPKMTPGKQDGETVNVPFSIPITFKLQGDVEEFNSLASKENQGIDVPFAVIEEVPVFPGCENAENPRECFQKSIQQHIVKHFRYPEEAQEKGIQGRVSIMFTISKDGSIQNVRMRGPDKLLEDEAARIISKLPKMTPGKQNGKVVNVPFSIPVNFKLQDLEESQSDAITIKNNGLDPIYIVDGVETSKEAFEKIKPDDIESVIVLKDESAIKKYGSKRANGVIEIKLKK